MTIGENLVTLRKNKHISQEKLADKLGITRQTLSNYENDITAPDLLQASKIAEVLDVSLDEIIGKNTLTSRITNTEKLVKKQNKNTKILLITIYFIILISLVSYTIYAFTNRDFTKKYQTEFTCYNKKEKNKIIYIEGLTSTTNSILIPGTDDITEDVINEFYIYVQNYDKEKQTYYDDEKIYAGKSIGESLDSVVKLKKGLIDYGYTCH